MEKHCDVCQNSKLDVGCQPCIDCDNPVAPERHDYDRCEQCQYSESRCKWMIAKKKQQRIDKPDKVGLYQIRCMESDGEWEHVAITEEGGRLMVHDPHLCRYDLDSYHNGLTDLEWKFIV